MRRRVGPSSEFYEAFNAPDQMLDDLLAISAIETGRFSIETAPVDAPSSSSERSSRSTAWRRCASVIVAADVSPDLPLLLADEERLLDVLENLIGNAVKFTAPGGSITIGASNQGSEILIWVKDSGVGIAAEQLPHIFDRFWQAQKKERRGIGLGLSICKAIVEAHGGRIWAESTVGVGTTMFFTVPAVPQAEQRSTRRARSPRSCSSTIARRTCWRCKAILEAPGLPAGDGQVRAKKRSPWRCAKRFAVALMDIAMPGMNGLEVAVHLKELERSRDIPHHLRHRVR